MTIQAYATYGIQTGWIFHISKWYESDSLVWIDHNLLFEDWM